MPGIKLKCPLMKSGANGFIAELINAISLGDKIQ